MELYLEVEDDEAAGLDDGPFADAVSRQSPGNSEVSFVVVFLDGWEIRTTLLV
jgi:hypothetical protein